MSKATEWAKRGDAAEFPKPEFVRYFDWPMRKAEIWQCSNRPVVVISGQPSLDAAEAIAFARWILATFEEPPR